MTKIEKQIGIALIVSIILLFVSCGAMINEINEAGGVKNIIIEVGKEVKDIGEKINEE